MNVSLYDLNLRINYNQIKNLSDQISMQLFTYENLRVNLFLMKEIWKWYTNIKLFIKLFFFSINMIMLILKYIFI